MNYKSLHSRRTRLAIIGVVLALCIAASATAYFLLRPHSKTVAQVNGVTITQADLDSQTAFPLAQTPGIFDSSGGAASKKDNDAYEIAPKDSRINSLAARGLDFCNRLFALERQWADTEPDQRYQLRLEASLPIFEEFISWAKSAGALPKSAPGRAIRYTLSQESYLKNVYLDGRLELSNNRAERSIKPFVIGRKNWLFANSVRGAIASATLYSIIETAKENNLKIFEYLTWLFEQFPDTSPERYIDLCPHSGSLPETLYITQ